MVQQRVSHQLFAAIIVAGMVLGCYILQCFDQFEGRFVDLFFSIRGERLASNNIVIVDIDEKSLNRLGQWPWPRSILSKISQELAKEKAKVVGFDIVFSEKDRTSPYLLLQQSRFSFLKDTLKKDQDDYDVVFSRSIKQAPVVLGYAFRFDNTTQSFDRQPISRSVIIEKNIQGIASIPEAKHAVLNLPILQQNAQSAGFFNTIPDSDGVVRSIPMLIRFHGQLYPSLSLEIFRLLSGSSIIGVEYSSTGVSRLKVGPYHIPVDRFGRLFVNYAGGSNKFTYISAFDIYSGHYRPEDIDGKVVLIGTSAVGLMDMRATPFENVMPGVEIHANAIDNLIQQSFIAQYDWMEGFEIVLMLLLALVFAMIFSYLSPLKIAISVLLFFTGYFLLSYYLIFHLGILITLFYPFLLMLLLVLVGTTMNYYFEFKQKNLIKSMFAKKVSKSVVEELLASSSESFEAKEREITIFFSDIRGFTTISESLGDPKRLIDLLNNYMTPMVDIIMRHEGTIDKFIGDAIMAYWNAPKKLLNHADHAVASAIEQISYLKLLNQLNAKKKWPKIDIGIGVHTGVAIVGEMGSVGRSDYTAIGDSVNLASRLEGLNKYYQTHIIISQYTYRLLKEEYAILELDKVKVKGKNEPIAIYQVLTSVDKHFQREKALHQRALELYRKGEFEQALLLFSSLQKIKKRHIYEIYRERCEHYLKNPPKDFNPVFTFITK